MKKILLYVSIVLGVIVFFFLGIAVFMMPAPGTELLGIKYISAVVGKHEQIIRQSFYDQEIYLYTKDVPINLTFVGKSTIGLEYVQHYQGFTRAGGTQGVDILDENGNAYNPNTSRQAHIYINQYSKFIWSNKGTAFYLNFNLPASYATSGKIHIISETSPVNISGRNFEINTLNIKTNNNIKIENNLKLQNLVIETNKAVDLSDNVFVESLIDVKIQYGDFVLSNPVNADIKFVTKTGELEFVSCNNLDMQSSSGSIVGSQDSIVYGNLNFTTSSGNIYVANIYGDNSNIYSVSGGINVDNCLGTLNINSNRATATVGSVESLNVTSTTGNVFVEEVTGNLSVESSRNGYVSAGTVGGNATIKTNTGKVVFSKAVAGDLSVTTNSGNIEFISCNNLTIETQSGNVSGYNGAKIVVFGGINISNIKGYMALSKVYGSAKINATTDNYIYSKNGSIEIDEISKNLSISSYNAKINIKSITSPLKIETSYSDINIGSAPYGVTVSSAGGNIVVGEQGNTSSLVGNLDITTDKGLVKAYNTVGTVFIASNNEIVLENKMSKFICLNTKGDRVYLGKGKITANNLMGEVKVCSEKDVDLAFAEISGNVIIYTKGSSSSVNIDANCASANKVDYKIQSENGGNCKVFIGGNLQHSSSYLSKETNCQYKITAVTTYASIDLKFAS